MSTDSQKPLQQSEGAEALDNFFYQRQPSEHVLQKKRVCLDDWSREFIAYTRLMFLATTDSDGLMYISPRGGEQGFLKVLDDHHLCFTDLPGNNLIESYKNIVVNDNVALICLIPGREETLRIQGIAVVQHLGVN